MAPHRPFRFGVQLANVPTADAWRETARKAENLGYSTLFMPDHFGDQLAPVPALMAAADATTTLRVGALVFDNDYKHPVVLAKEAATIDWLSGGRFELGLGAGWMRTDYEESGIPYDPPGTRVDRFEEGVQIIRGLLGPDPVSFEGKHYRITNHDGLPKPAQDRVPILVGGGGKRVLRLAGRHADIVGINFDLRGGAISGELGPNGTAEATQQKLDWVREGAGDRYDDLELNINVFFTIITDDREGTLQAMSGGFQLTPEQAADVPHVLVGPVEQLADLIVERRERFGFSYVTFSGDVIEQMAPVVSRLAGT